MSEQRKVYFTPPRPFSGDADPRYLLAEIEELRDIARAAGLGSLDYLLECAAREARWLSEQSQWGEHERPAAPPSAP
jgi:hypothetical protein